MTEHLNVDFHSMLDKPTASAGFRVEPEDFQVFENLHEAPAGEGEHIYVHIQKRNNNTTWLAKQVARVAGVQNMDVGYAGLKDRRAVTQQWFSIYLPKGAEPDWKSVELEGCEVLSVSRGRSKLRRGSHADNRFVIRLRDITGSKEQMDARLQALNGVVPNYFGEQRFGIDGGNLQRAKEWFEDGIKIRNRQQKQFIVSAARSYLFNRVLSERVLDGSWLELLEGDVPMDGRATGPLWGRGRLETQAQVLALEEAQMQPYHHWCHELEHQGLSQDRRALALYPMDFDWQWQEQDLTISMRLPPGAYATSVLREICQLQVPEDTSY